MNKIDYKKLLAELGDDLKNSTSNLKQELSNARSLYTRIQNYANSAQSLVEKITNEETGLEKVLTNAQGLESQISALKTNADTHLQSITSSLTTIQTNIVAMETAYSTFSEINKKITNEETGLEAILSESESLKSDIEATKNTSVTIFKEISKLKDTASGYVTELKNIATSAKKTVEQIEKNHKESEDLKDKINTIFNISSQRGHANYFDDRQRRLLKISVGWLVASVAILVLTLYLGEKYIFPLVQMLENGENELVKTITTEALLIRLGLMTPVIFSLVYCLGQYGHERRFHEQYAFKAVSMLSIESSIQLLGRSLSNVSDIGDRDNKITTFALHTLELIYKDPVETNKKSLLFRGGNNLLELSAEMSESFGEIKEIKSGIEKLVENNEKGKT